MNNLKDDMKENQNYNGIPKTDDSKTKIENSNNNNHELIDQDLDKINGGFRWFPVPKVMSVS